MRRAERSKSLVGLQEQKCSEPPRTVAICADRVSSTVRGIGSFHQSLAWRAAGQDHFNGHRIPLPLQNPPLFSVSTRQWANSYWSRARTKGLKTFISVRRGLFVTCFLLKGKGVHIGGDTGDCMQEGRRAARRVPRNVCDRQRCRGL